MRRIADLINVSSMSGLSPEQAHAWFYDRGYRDDDLPNCRGEIPRAAFSAVSSGYSLWGRRAIRDYFWPQYDALIGSRRHTKQRINQLLRGAEDFIIETKGVWKSQTSSIEAFAEQQAQRTRQGIARRSAELKQYRVAKAGSGDLS